MAAFASPIIKFCLPLFYVIFHELPLVFANLGHSSFPVCVLLVYPTVLSGLWAFACHTLVFCRAFHLLIVDGVAVSSFCTKAILKLWREG